MKRLLLTLLLLAGLAGVYGYLVTRWENSHRDLIRRGDAAMAAGDYSTAIELFSGAIALKQDSMVGYLMRGDAYRRRDELEAALRDLRQAAEIDPGAPRPRELLGDVNYARHRFPPAADHYQAYVDLDDRSPRVLYKLALARYRAGQPTLGIVALQKAVAIDERFAEAHYLMGLCQRDAQRPADALVSLQKAIALAPARALLQAREELADLYGRLGRTEEWITQLEALKALDPGPARDVALGLAYSKAGQSDRAVITLRAAERYPGLPSRLCRPRPRLAGNGAGPVGSGRPQQGARGAREGHRRGEHERGVHAVRPRAAARLGRRARRTDAAAGHRQAAGRSAGVLLPGRRRGTPRALQHRAAGATRLRSARRRRSRPAQTRRHRRPHRRSLDARGRLRARRNLVPTALPRPSRSTRRSWSSRPKHAGARDSDAARTMLERLLEKNPGNVAARNLLRRVR